MGHRVIQGFFIGGERLAPPTKPPASALSDPRLTAPVGTRPGLFGPPASALPPRGSRAEQQRIGAGRIPLAHAPAPGMATPGDRRALQSFGGGDGSFAIDPAQVGLVRSGGMPLPQALLARMEAAFETDFSSVRIHIGPQASRIGAIAFTTGSDLYFAPGQYQPDSVKGRQLIGHELAHVVQQRQGRVRAPGHGVTVVQDRLLEAEADRLGMRAASFQAVNQRSAATATVQRAAISVSAPQVTGPGHYRLTALADGHAVGSVMVHTTRPAAAEITDLGVDAAHRDQGIGAMLLAHAARAGMRFGKSMIGLAADDSGSGQLKRWYRDLGFAPAGIDSRGRTRFTASAAQIGRAVTQAKMGPAGPMTKPNLPGSRSPFPEKGFIIQRANAQRRAEVTLTINGDRYTGVSSGQYGHAEMEALRKFIRAYDGDTTMAAAVLEGGNPTVDCQNQPVCPSCSLILKSLGFAAANDQTEFGNEKSGGVSWGGNMVVEEFMKSCNLQDVYAEAKRKGAK